MKKILLAAAALLAVASPLESQTIPSYTGPGGAVLPAAGVFIVGGVTWFTETSTPLDASGTFYGQARQTSPIPASSIPFQLVTGISRHTMFTVDAFADQAGTVFIEKSMNGGQTWVPVNGNAGTPLAAGSSVQLVTRISALYYRVRFVNGSTAQTQFYITTALTNS